VIGRKPQWSCALRRSNWRSVRAKIKKARHCDSAGLDRGAWRRCSTWRRLLLSAGRPGSGRAANISAEPGASASRPLMGNHYANFRAIIDTLLPGWALKTGHEQKKKPLVADGGRNGVTMRRRQIALGTCAPLSKVFPMNRALRARSDRPCSGLLPPHDPPAIAGPLCPWVRFRWSGREN